MKRYVIYAVFALILTVTISVAFIHYVTIYAATHSVYNETTLKNAISTANAGDTIQLNGDITLTSAIDIDKSLNFEVITEGQLFAVLGNFRHFNVTGEDIVLKFIGAILFEGGTFYNGNGGGFHSTAKSLTIEGMEYYRFNGGMNGCAIYSTTPVILKDSNIHDNISTANGGAVYLDGAAASLTVINSYIARNTANNGGAIYATGGATVNIENGTISDNKINTSGFGGGVYISSGVLNIKGGVITENQAVNGGGVYSLNAAVHISGGDISDHAITGVGGGIYFTGGTLIMSDGMLSGNRAVSGGAIYAAGATVTNINGGKIAKNQASTGGGGGIYSAGTKVTISGTAQIGSADGSDKNTAVNGYGGGIYTPQDNCVIEVSGGSILGNEAQKGGGIATSGTNCTITINGGDISYNKATVSKGGGVLTSGASGRITMSGGTVSNNTAAASDINNGGGGGLATEGSAAAISISGGVVSDNEAPRGGGVCSNVGVVTLSGTAQIINNKANHSNGAAIFTYGNLAIGAVSVYIQDDAVISGNIAAINGGAVHTAGNNAKINMTGGLVENNVTQSKHGGAFFTSTASADILVYGGSLIGNRATGDGGAIFSNHALVDIQNATINNNIAGISGGAIDLNYKDATLKVDKSTISGNTAKNGGAICTNNNYDVSGTPIVSITETIMELNKAVGGSGGAINTLGNNATVFISSSKIGGNTTTANGGAVYTGGTAGGAHVTCISSEITSNIANNRGGGIYVSSGSFILDGEGSNISNNTSQNSGGGVYVEGVAAAATIKQGKITKNKSIAGNGGGIYVATLANLTVESGVEFSNNLSVKPYAWTLDTTGESMYTVLHDNKIKTTLFTNPFTNLYNNYDVNFAANGIIYKGNGSGQPDIVIPYQKDELVTVTDNPFIFTGKNFDSWNTDEDGLGEEYLPGFGIKMGLENVVLYAQWENITCTVTFESNGGTNVTGITADYGSTITAPTSPTYTGRTFAGWYKDEALLDDWDFATDTVVSNVMLYAKWTLDSYTVTFESNGGTDVDPQTVTAENGYKVEEPNPEPVKSSAAFIGWYKEITLENEWDFDGDKVVSDIALYAKWIMSDQQIFSVTYKANGGVGEDIVTIHDEYATITIASNSFVRSNYSFAGWNSSDTGDGDYYPVGSEVVVDDNLVLYALWNRNGGGSGIVIAKLVVEFRDENGNLIYDNKTDEVVGSNKTIIAPSITGYELNDSNTKSIIIITGTNTLIFEYKKIYDIPKLEMSKHVKYINGYPNKTVRPDNDITRSEAAAIFFRLTADVNKNQPLASKFSDVSQSAWYVQEIAYLAKHGIIKGYEDGTFKPDQPITRAEFATLASRFDNLEQTSVNVFSDLSDSHWAAAFINSAYAKNWINGYPDGTFMQDNNIIRAEVVKIVNAMLNRRIQLGDIPNDVVKYTDLEASYWGYCDIIEASVEHDYTRKEDEYELWANE